ncbi:MAG: IS1634 family transposase [Candidatus Cloacimonetes bacterium]|nr:IS1634 family transposase [Candidatus Cloacimonadota bacterium]
MKTYKSHNKKYNITYVYEYVNYWDKAKKQSRTKQKLIGRIDPVTGEVIPTDGRMRKAQERKIENNAAGKSIVMSPDYSRKYCGATYLLDGISNKLGVTNLLKQNFPDTYKQLLSIAYYIILGKSNALCNFDQFDHHTKHPYNQNIPSQRSSELFINISQQATFDFVKQFKTLHTECEYWAYDTTSFSSFSEKLRQIKFGYNKENDIIAQLNFAVVFGEKSNMPFYYRKLTGNVPDSKTVKILIDELNDYHFEKLKLVMDKGNFSVDNINSLIENQYDFLIPSKMQMKFVKNDLETIKSELPCFENYNAHHNVYSKTTPIKWEYQVFTQEPDIKVKKDKNLYLHFYFNPEQKEKDMKKFNRKLDDLRQELLSGEEQKQNKVEYNKYFNVSILQINDEEKIIVSPKESVIKEAMKNFGYMVLLSSENMDSITALEIYRNKDIVEKAICTIKGTQGFRRLLVSNEKSLEGKMFVEYIALILLSHIKKQMEKLALKYNKKYYTMQKLFSAIDSIECFECKNKKIRYSEISEKQKIIFKDFEINHPA